MDNPIVTEVFEGLPQLDTSIARLVVVSDIHAVSTGEGAVVAEDRAGQTNTNALSSATQLLKTEGIKADILACPGDLIHAGASEPLPWVWKELGRMSEALSAPLIATVGNHDLVRAPAEGANPQEALRKLKPRFPGPDAADATRFWGDGFSSTRSTDGRWRLVTVDTCQLIGYHPNNATAGLLRGDTLELLREFLAQDEAAQINILMCHHQPQEWTHPTDKTTSHLQRGDLLLTLLDELPESWMVLHGHKHEPLVDYFGRGTSGPVRLAAGSVGANVAAEAEIANQMHIIDFDLASQDHGLSMAGTVFSADWHPGFGWAKSTMRSGLTDQTGFGFRRDGAELAWWAEHRFGSATLSWTKILEEEPRFRYLAPRDLMAFIAAVQAPRSSTNGSTAGTVRTSTTTGRIEEVTLR